MAAQLIGANADLNRPGPASGSKNTQVPLPRASSLPRSPRTRWSCARFAPDPRARGMHTRPGACAPGCVHKVARVCAEAEPRCSTSAAQLRQRPSGATHTCRPHELAGHPRHPVGRCGRSTRAGRCARARMCVCVRREAYTCVRRMVPQRPRSPTAADAHRDVLHWAWHGRPLHEAARRGLVGMATVPCPPPATRALTPRGRAVIVAMQAYRGVRVPLRRCARWRHCCCLRTCSLPPTYPSPRWPCDTPCAHQVLLVAGSDATTQNSKGATFLDLVKDEPTAKRLKMVHGLVAEGAHRRC